MASWLPFALLAVGILAIYIEIFVPAAGLIGLAGGGTIVASVVLAYVYLGPTLGTIMLFTSLVVTPTAVILGLRAFPRTPMGRRLILWGDRSSADAGRPGAATTAPLSDASGAAAAAVVAGDEGEAFTVLRPSGTARIGGRKVSVVTSGEYVERGARVRVLRVEGNRIVVRQAN